MTKTQKQRGFKRLTIQDRDLIEIRYYIDKKSISSIANELGKHISTVVREINGKPRSGLGKYSAKISHEEKLRNRKKQGRTCKLDDNEDLRLFVISKLKGNGTPGCSWSPEQIAGYINEHTNMEHICMETIYSYVYAQIHRGGNGHVKKGCEDLRPFLVRRHTKRAKKGFRKVQKIEKNKALPSIEERPEIVLERTEVGHLEGDTIVSRQSAGRLKTINELVSGVVFIAKTSGGTAEICNQAIIDRLSEIPREYRKTLTQDRGSENYEYETVVRALSIDMYFAHSYCSYERGANENTNGLIRRYLPKGTDFDKITTKRILEIEYQLNTRPRKRLGYLSPYQVYYKMTGIDLESIIRRKISCVRF